jgi:hypothetical protein
MTQRSTKTRDRLGALLVVVLAAVAGLVAAHYGTHRTWERPTTVDQGSR